MGEQVIEGGDTHGPSGCRLWDDVVELFLTTDAKAYRDYANGYLWGV